MRKCCLPIIIIIIYDHLIFRRSNKGVRKQLDNNRYHYYFDIFQFFFYFDLYLPTDFYFIGLFPIIIIICVLISRKRIGAEKISSISRKCHTHLRVLQLMFFFHF